MLFSQFTTHCSAGYFLEGIMLVERIILSRSRMRETVFRPLEHSWITALWWWCVHRQRCAVSFSYSGGYVPKWALPWFPGFGGKAEFLAAHSSRWVQCFLWALQGQQVLWHKEGAGQIELLACASKSEDPQQGLNFAPNWLIYLIRAVYLKALYKMDM